MSLRGGGLACLCITLLHLLCLPGSAGAQVRLLAEFGPELDSNATRLQQLQSAAQDAILVQDPSMAALLRLVGRGEFGLRLQDCHYLSLAYGGGAKVFLSEAARLADELVQHGDLSWAVRLPTGMLALQGSFYDAYQRDSVRDFRTATGLLRFMLGHPPSGLGAALFAGYRWLQYKPNEDYSFHALRLGTELSWRPTTASSVDLADWNLGLQYAASLRSYQGSAQARCFNQLDGPFPCETVGDRRDLNHYLRAQVHYLGAGDLALSYAGELNQSNSYGESFLRHAIALRFTAAIVWGIFLTAKGTLQLSKFEDPFLISEVGAATFISIDDENRSSLIAQLARDLDERWTLHLRYSLYVNESSAGNAYSQTADDAIVAESMVDAPAETSAPSFLRHTLFVGVRFEYEKLP